MHPSTRESLVHARSHVRAKCLGEAIDQLAIIGATIRFGRSPRVGFRHEVTIEGIGQPSIGVSDCPFLALEDALTKLVKRACRCDFSFEGRACELPEGHAGAHAHESAFEGAA